MWLVVRKYVDNLMFRSEELKGTFRLQNNYELQPTQFSTRFNHEYGERVTTHISCVYTKLQTNYKRSFNKSVMKDICKISLSDFSCNFFVYL